MLGRARPTDPTSTEAKLIALTAQVDQAVALADQTMRGETTGWRDRAACRGHDPDMWTTAATSDPTQKVANRRAIRICNTCPVRPQCLQYGRHTGSVGVIYGGIRMDTNTSRRRIKIRSCPVDATLFEVRHSQRYCSPKCSHLARQRRMRHREAG